MSIQDGRLALAYFLPNYKCFDQILQAVKNETTVLNLVFKGFLHTSIQPLILYFMQKGVSQFSVENLLSHSTETFRRGTLLCFRKFLVSKIVKDKRGLVSRFSVEIGLSHTTETFRRRTLLCFRKIAVSKTLWIRGGEGGSIKIFRRQFIVSQYQKTL